MSTAVVDLKKAKTARKRIRIANGIYRDRWGIAAIVRVRPHPQKESRWPFGTDLKDIKRWQNEQRALFFARSRRPTRGTLRADAKAHLHKKRHEDGLVSWNSRASELDAWCELILDVKKKKKLGDLPRARVLHEHVLKARTIWLAQKYSPKTINNRVGALRAFYHERDGARAWTPCDDVEPLEVNTPQPRLVSPARIKAVAQKLIDIDRDSFVRFLVLTATGRRPSELKRATESDVDIRRRLWMVQTGKGGDPTPIYLNNDMLFAWKLFIKSNLWGAFDVSTYDKHLYAAGWPQQWTDGYRRRRNLMRPYQARHSVAITLGDKGSEWEDIREWLGHKSIKTTRIYTGVIASRLKRTSQRLTGRLGWQSLKMRKKPA